MMVGMTVLNPAQAARKWRDEELLRTDVAATVSDFPNAEAVIAYRQLLRDWPASEQWPHERPTMVTE